MPLPSTPAFLGRAGELAALRERLDAAAAGEGSLVLLAGEPGIGKTRLVEELASDAARRGVRVLWGRCYEGDGAPPFWPWVQVLRAALRNADRAAVRAELGGDTSLLAALVPELCDAGDAGERGGSETGEDRFRLFAAVTAFLTARAATTPLLLVLEDLHWADVPSLLLFEFLAQAARGVALLLAGTFRDTEVTDGRPLGRTLGRLARLPRAEWLTMRGLAPEDVAAVITDVTGRPASPAFAAAVTATTDGNPFFVVELARYRAAGDDSTGDATVAIPPSVRDVIGLRTGELSPACNRLLMLGAVIGREFPLRALEQASEASSERTLAVLEEAETARLIAPAAPPGCYRFTHALVREALYAGLPSTRRAQLHLRAAEALERVWGEEPEHLAEIATHFHQAAGGAAKAAHYARLAAEHALAVCAYEEAVRYFELALGALESGTPAGRAERCNILIALAEAWQGAGEPSAARAVHREAAAIARGLPSAERMARIATAFRTGVDVGRVDDEWVTLLDEALAMLSASADAWRARALTYLAHALYYATDPRAQARRREAIEEAERVARGIGDPVALVRTLILRDATMTPEESPTTAAERVAEALALLASIGDRRLTALVRRYHARRRLEAGAIAEAEADMLAVLAIQAELREPDQPLYRTVWETTCALLAGRFADAEELLARGRLLARESRHGEVAGYGLIQLIALRRAQGRAGEVERPAQRLAESIPASAVFQALALAVLAEDGRTDAARDGLLRFSADDFAAVSPDMTWLTAMTAFADVTAAIGDVAAAASLYERLRPYAGRHAVMGLYALTCDGSVSRPLGVLAALLARWDDAERHFEQALTMNAILGARPLLARTRHDYGDMLLARHRVACDRRQRVCDHIERARELLHAALGTARELGMAGLTSRCAERLQALESSDGAARRPGDSTSPGALPAPRAAFPNGLTGREVDVLRLVAAGYSNQQIADALVVSLATVRGHTISIYGKIGASGRAAAAAYALRHGITPPDAL